MKGREGGGGGTGSENSGGGGKKNQLMLFLFIGIYFCSCFIIKHPGLMLGEMLITCVHYYHYCVSCISVSCAVETLLLCVHCCMVQF